MQLIDVVTSMYRDLARKGLRAAAWTMDAAALAQLRDEASQEGSDVLSIASPPTFLGVPIEIAPKQDSVKADFVVNHCRFAPCQRLDRPVGQQWDIFDLDAHVALQRVYSTKTDANAAALAMDLSPVNQR